MQDKDKKKNEEEKRRIKTIIKIIIIIIIILLLLIACTSKSFGRIGQIFNQETDVNIDKDSGEEEKVINDNLRFNNNTIQMFLSDNEARLSFTYKNIKPQKMTCTTSDASIATCYVKDGYVIIIPKSVGEVDITLETNVNGKKYLATAKAKVLEPDKYISLSKESGTLDLYYNKQLLIPFSLVKLSGNISISISDPSIANANIKSNVLILTGKKSGKTTVTLKVTDGDKTYTATFTLKVINSSKEVSTNKENNKSTKNYLKNLTISEGTLSPEFSKNVYDYTVHVGSDVDKLTINSTANSSDANLSYKFNGKEVDSLKNLELLPGTNTVEVTVKGNNGSSVTYTITITKESNVNLENIIPSDSLPLTPEFNSDITYYEMDVKYNEEIIDFGIIKSDNNTKIVYRFNGNIVKSLDNLSLKFGRNVVEITVMDGNESKIYTLVIYRPARKIEISTSSTDVYVEQGQVSVTYEVLEYNRKQDKWVKVDDYNLNDITVSYNGKFNLDKDVITIYPDKNDIGKSKNLTLKYEEETANTDINTKMYDYFLNLENDSYEFLKSNSKDIILNNNMFPGGVSVEKTKDGIILRDKNNSDVYIEVIGDIEVQYKEGDSSIVLRIKGNNIGQYHLVVKGFAYGHEIKSFDININILNEITVNLYANDGYYNAFTNEYNFIFNEETEFKLSDYIAYFYDKSNCKYYKIIGYSERQDAMEGDKDVYSIDENIIVTYNMNLYAVYSKTPLEKDPFLNKWLYLEDADIFKNDEYYEKYNIKNMIYPGVKGEYLMNITNEKGKDITITGISLNEVATICKDGKCLNMGYKIIAENGKELYSNNSDYKVLNKDVLITSLAEDTYKGAHDLNLKLAPGETTRIKILWKWVEIDDAADTIVGKFVAEASKRPKYGLSVGIRFDENNDNVCK